MRYLITTQAFWDNLPYFQELSCGRVRFTTSQVPFDGLILDTKAQALQKIFASPKGTWLIREQEYKPDHWIYEAIIGKTPPGSSDEGD